MLLNIPNRIVSGDFVSWTDSLSDYPNDSYSLTWALRSEINFLDLIATNQGTDFLTTITAMQSDSLAAGAYYWQAYMTDISGNRTAIESGRLEVSVNLATVQSFDGRRDSEKMLVQVNSAIASVMQNQSYKIKDREWVRADLVELIKLRDKLKVEVYREKQADLGESPNLYVRFGRL